MRPTDTAPSVVLIDALFHRAVHLDVGRVEIDARATRNTFTTAFVAEKREPSATQLAVASSIPEKTCSSKRFVRSMNVVEAGISPTARSAAPARSSRW